MDASGRERLFSCGNYREFIETPIWNAFCRVAPSLRFSDLATFAAGVFPFAMDFNWRMSSFVQGRRADVFLAEAFFDVFLAKTGSPFAGVAILQQGPVCNWIDAPHPILGNDSSN